MCNPAYTSHAGAALTSLRLIAAQVRHGVEMGEEDETALRAIRAYATAVIDNDLDALDPANIHVIVQREMR